MAEAEGPSPSPPSKAEWLEVKCNSSGETRRFAPGTDAAFAVSVINRKLMVLGSKSKSKKSSCSLPLALHIEAFKEDEEPISFGPNSPLLNYGHGWILQTVVDLHSSSDDVKAGDGIPAVTKKTKGVTPHPHLHPHANIAVLKADFTPSGLTPHPHPHPRVNAGSEGPVRTKVTKPAMSLVYIGKIILAIILLFLIGAIFTLALENLPILISFVTSSF